MSDLSSLIARLEAAEGPSVELDYLLSEEFRGTRLGAPDYTASIDDAVSLAERVLPGWGWGVTHGSEKAEDVQGNVFPKIAPMPANLDCYGYHRVPAIALVLATLRALDQKGSSNG